MSNDNGNADDLKIGDEELNNIDLDQLDPNNATPEEILATIKVAKTAVAQREHWRNKAIDKETGKPFKDLFTEAQGKTSPNTNVVSEKTTDGHDEETKDRLSRLEFAEEKRQFGHLKNLSPEEADVIFAYAKGAGVKPAEALDHPFVKQGLDALRRENKNSSAIPNPSARSPKVEGKTFKEMKEDDRRKHFADVVKASTQR